ncbi:PECT1, partial [Symbiodinium sp. KB8]
DGCFDCYHFGHSNALRQARAVGDVLLVGVHTDSEVQRIKGSAPVTPEQERYAALRACKFVDEVIEGAPYVPTKEWIDTLRSQYGVDYIVHGDDPCFTPDGQDAYAYAKELNMFKIVKRTEGVSTTDLVGRMLLMTREHHVHTPVDPAASGDFKRLRSASWADEATTTAGQSHFLPTARRIRQFASDRVPTKSDKVVYLPGAFDLFTEGHIQAMKAAKALGTFLVVGVYDDQTVNKVQGGGHPVMNLHERSLSVLACRYADEVIIGAPRHVTEDLLTSMNVSVVAHGTASEGKYLESFGQGVDAPDDPFFVAKKAGKFHVFASPSSMLVTTVIERVMAHREELAAKVKRKAKAESSYYSNTKTYVSEG